MSRQNKKIIIRAGRGTLAFLTKEDGSEAVFHPYVVKSGMSLAANLREAFKEQDWLAGGAANAQLLVTTPVVLLPLEEYQDNEAFDAESIYSGVITKCKGDEKVLQEVRSVDAMSIFAVNRDLRMVVGDNCDNVEVGNVTLPVLHHFYSRYYQSGQRRKLFAYFHDKMVDLCSFDSQRIRFANTFEATHAHDALYYILFVWKQLGMDGHEDSLHVIGEMPHEQWLRGRLQSYLSNIYDVNPVADLNRSPLAEIEGMPFDMMLCGL